MHLLYYGILKELRKLKRILKNKKKSVQLILLRMVQKFCYRMKTQFTYSIHNQENESEQSKHMKKKCLMPNSVLTENT